MVKLYAFDNPIHWVSLDQALLAILDIAIYILFPVIVMMIIYTGFLFVSARGNPQKIEAARKALIWTVVGGLIILGARALTLGIKATIAPLIP